MWKVNVRERKLRQKNNLEAIFGIFLGDWSSLGNLNFGQILYLKKKKDNMWFHKFSRVFFHENRYCTFQIN